MLFTYYLYLLPYSPPRKKKSNENDNDNNEVHGSHPVKWTRV